MNTTEIKQLAIRALENMKGDNTYRAECSFRGMSSKQMQEQHGQSGKTRAEILTARSVISRSGITPLVTNLFTALWEWGADLAAVTGLHISRYSQNTFQT